MTLSERCENFYEKQKLDKMIEKFKDVFYNYDWENLDGNDIFKYQRITGDKCRHVILRMAFLREIATLANISDDFKLNSLFLNTLVEQGMIDSYDFGNNDGMDVIKINIEEYERNKKSYIHFKEVTEPIEDDSEENEKSPNINYKTGYLSDVGSELYRKSVWKNFYNNDTVIIRPHIHNLMEDPNDIPVYENPVILFIFSIPNGENIITLPGWYDSDHHMWKRSSDDSPIEKDRICGWSDFQKYENVAESKT